MRKARNMRTIDFDDAPPIQLFLDLLWITLQQRCSLQPLLTLLHGSWFLPSLGIPFQPHSEKGWEIHYAMISRRTSVLLQRRGHSCTTYSRLGPPPGSPAMSGLLDPGYREEAPWPCSSALLRHHTKAESLLPQWSLTLFARPPHLNVPRQSLVASPLERSSFF